MSENQAGSDVTDMIPGSTGSKVFDEHNIRLWNIKIIKNNNPNIMANFKMNKGDNSDDNNIIDVNLLYISKYKNIEVALDDLKYSKIYLLIGSYGECFGNDLYISSIRYKYDIYIGYTVESNINAMINRKNKMFDRIDNEIEDDNIILESAFPSAPDRESEYFVYITENIYGSRQRKLINTYKLTELDVIDLFDQLSNW